MELGTVIGTLPGPTLPLGVTRSPTRSRWGCGSDTYQLAQTRPEADKTSLMPAGSEGGADGAKAFAAEHCRMSGLLVQLAYLFLHATICIDALDTAKPNPGYIC